MSISPHPMKNPERRDRDRRGKKKKRNETRGRARQNEGGGGGVESHMALTLALSVVQYVERTRENRESNSHARGGTICFHLLHGLNGSVFATFRGNFKKYRHSSTRATDS